jgi:hypothetical protein
VNSSVEKGRTGVPYLLDELGHEAFGFTVGVEVGGIDRVDAEVPCGFDDLEGRFFVEDPRLDEEDMRLWSQGAGRGRTHTPCR